VGYHHVQRVVWLAPTLEWLKAFHRPVLASELSDKLKGTPGQCPNNSVLYSRLMRMAKEGMCFRINPDPGMGRLGVRWEAAAITPANHNPGKPAPIIIRHRGQVDA
jgi:hypothetical protein